jgi:DNA-binding CsgD family transcriptional regulator
MIQLEKDLKENPNFHHGASYQAGGRSITAHRSNHELQTHRKRARDIRIHRAQAPRQHSWKARLSDHRPINRARDRRPSFGRQVDAFFHPRPSLRPRELEVVRLVCDGLTSKEIARRLRISPLTVRKHRENAMRTLAVHSMAELMDIAQALDFASTPSEPYRRGRS